MTLIGSLLKGGVPCRSQKRQLEIDLDFLYSLPIQNTGNFAYTGDDSLEVLHVFDVDGYVDVGTVIVSAHVHMADIGVVIAYDRGELLEQASAIVATDGELHG